MFHHTSGYLLRSKDYQRGSDLESFVKKLSVADDDFERRGRETETWTHIHYLDRVQFVEISDHVQSQFEKGEKHDGETFVGTTNLSKSYEVFVMLAEN